MSRIENESQETAQRNGKAQRVWVMSELYYPEETSTGYFLTGIAEGLAKTYDVRVLCSQPTYSSRGIRAPALERRNGVTVQRCWGTRFNKDVLPLRVLNIVTITLSIFVLAFTRIRRSDRVLVVTNPAPLPFVVSIACRLRGAKCLLLIHDVYPDVLIAAGMARAGSLVARSAEALTTWLYRGVQRIVVLGRDMEKVVAQKLRHDGKRIVIIPNWGDLMGIKPGSRASNPLLKQLGLTDKFVVQYCGNMGRTHGLEDLVQSAAKLKNHPGIHFLLIGWGAKRGWLERTILQNGMQNVTVLPARRRDQLDESLNACDVSIMALIPGMAGISVPSRVYDVLAAGKPVIAVADEISEVAMVVREEQIGWVVPPGEPDRLVEAILEAYESPQRRSELAQRARATAEEKYSWERIVDAYCKLIDGLRETGAGAS